MNKSTLGRKERGRIDYGSRSNFLRGSSLGGLISGGGGSGSSRSGFTATSGLTTTSRIASLLATAGRLATLLATTSGLTASALALTATEDAIEQGDAATLLYDTLGRTGVTALLTTASRLSAASGIASLLTATSGLGATSGLRTTGFAAALLAVVPTEQVQQRGLAALLGTAPDVATLVAALLATASRLTTLVASLLATASRIRTARVATAITNVLLALRAIAQEVQQRCLAAFRLARHALHVASGFAAAAGSRIRTRCVTAADFITAAVEIVSEHSVEQIPTEALSAKA